VWPGENGWDINSVENMKMAIRSVFINYSGRKLLKGETK
jgi:hypothetical protein